MRNAYGKVAHKTVEHPGVVIARLMIERNIGEDEVARQSRVDLSVVQDIIALNAYPSMVVSEKLGAVFDKGKGFFYKIGKAHREETEG